MATLYCTEVDLAAVMSRDTLAHYTNDAGGTDPDSAITMRCIDLASRDIDAALGGRFQAPFADGSIPDVVRASAAVITRFHVFARRGFDAGGRDKHVIDSYHAALAALREMSSPGGGGAIPGAPSQEDALSLTSFPQVFTRGNMAGL